MSKKSFLILCGFLFLLWTPPVFSQAKKETKKVSAPAPAKSQKSEKIREFNFEGDVVDAQFLKPDQGVTEVISRKKKSLLIQIRTDFIDEILRTVEDL